jgi:hypothetical protein
MVVFKGQDEGPSSADGIAGHITEIRLNNRVKTMLGWREKREVRERVDLLSNELFEAMRASEEEIDETALSPNLLSRVQSRIAINRRRMEIASLAQSNSHARRHRSYLAWAAPTAAAAAILLALTCVAYLSRTNRTTSATREIAKVSPAADEPTASVQLTREAAKEAASARSKFQSVSKVRRHHPAGETANFELAELMSEEQQATEFLPLTLIPEGRPEEKAGENHQIVRMTLPRTALLAFGVPMNMERAGELVTADVMFGEDGVAHAIRFVH